jgi:hypothetical protein
MLCRNTHLCLQWVKPSISNKGFSNAGIVILPTYIGRRPGFEHPFRWQAAMDGQAQDGQQNDPGDKSRQFEQNQALSVAIDRTANPNGPSCRSAIIKPICRTGKTYRAVRHPVPVARSKLGKKSALARRQVAH